ncbi:hypothetical protein [Dokdonella sp.]|uniref:hypothetical protein n=1 Tax=Dokdonella sp. TaxID=2291710 RepID=UPI0025B9F78C|nr:hypothetical protein [Dokdonella sp.]MBX3689509.1 hypothetical protein [Dokdonella sp.]
MGEGERAGNAVRPQLRVIDGGRHRLEQELLGEAIWGNHDDRYRARVERLKPAGLLTPVPAVESTKLPDPA